MPVMTSLPEASIAVVSVPVSDPEQAKAFYVETLGFELIRDDASTGRHWVQVRPSPASPSLTLVNWFASMPAGSLRGLVLRVDDLDVAYDRLASAGVDFQSPPQDHPWAREAVLRDPDGNELVLQQAAA